MKNLKFILLLLAVTLMFNVETFAKKKKSEGDWSKKDKKEWSSDDDDKDWSGGSKSYKSFDGDHCSDTGVPLDGGLLSILGAAGIGYFVTRKRKKSNV